MQKTFSKMEHNKGNLKVCVEEDIKFHNMPRLGLLCQLQGIVF